MSSRLNLNDNTNTKFEFTVGGLDYDLNYPTLEDLEPIQDKFKELRRAQNNEGLAESERDAAVERITDEAQGLIYAMIVPVGHNTPIEETIAKQPYPVVKAFNKMMNEQLAAE